MKTKGIYTVAVLGLAIAAMHAQAEPASSNLVPLSPGTCPVVQDGDIVVFDWNPTFEPATSFGELENFRLRFTAPLERRTTRSGSVLELRLRPQHSAAPVETPLEDIHNGYFRMRFRVNAPTLASGEYHLESAEAETKAAADGPSIHAVMTNDPLHSAFCVTLIGVVKEEMKGKKGPSN